MTDYTELQTAIIEDTHRADLASLVPRFIRLGEGLIRRDLKAYELTAVVTDSDRTTTDSPIYQLPGRVLEVRTIHLVGATGDGLTRVMPNAIRRLPITAGPCEYCQNGNDTIEFRGNPSVDHEFDVRYFGTPAPLEDTPTNSLLDDHESLYQTGAQYFLYLHTQDRELAQDQATTFDAVMDRINEAMARKIGGGAVAPTYNMQTRSSY